MCHGGGANEKYLGEFAPTVSLKSGLIYIAVPRWMQYKTKPHPQPLSASSERGDKAQLYRGEVKLYLTQPRTATSIWKNANKPNKSGFYKRLAQVCNARAFCGSHRQPLREVKSHSYHHNWSFAQNI
jgi:hypothetical protein